MTPGWHVNTAEHDGLGETPGSSLVRRRCDGSQTKGSRINNCGRGMRKFQRFAGPKMPNSPSY